MRFNILGYIHVEKIHVTSEINGMVYASAERLYRPDTIRYLLLGMQYYDPLSVLDKVSYVDYLPWDSIMPRSYDNSVLQILECRLGMISD